MPDPRPVEFAIVTPSYNNEYWCSKNLASVAEQTYPHWHLHYIDDASTDGTLEFVQMFIQNEALKNRCTLIHNVQRVGSLANFYSLIHTIDPHKVVVCLDGDDYFSRPDSLEVLAKAYQDPNIWLTYGSFDTDPQKPDICLHPYTKEVCEKNSFRDDTFSATHIKTFYAKLFQLIKKEDLLIQGQFFPVAGDMAFMFPMLEMASRGHIQFIKEILYIYNVSNPLNDWKYATHACQVADQYIRKKERYKPLERLF